MYVSRDGERFSWVGHQHLERSEWYHVIHESRPISSFSNAVSYLFPPIILSRISCTKAPSWIVVVIIGYTIVWRCLSHPPSALALSSGQCKFAQQVRSTMISSIKASDLSWLINKSSIRTNNSSTLPHRTAKLSTSLFEIPLEMD